MPDQKPRLELNLSDPDTTILVVAYEAARLVPGKSQEMSQKLLQAGSYDRALEIVREYVDLVDTSGKH